MIVIETEIEMAISLSNDLDGLEMLFLLLLLLFLLLTQVLDNDKQCTATARGAHTNVQASVNYAQVDVNRAQKELLS